MTLLSGMGELYRTDLALWAAQQAEALRSAARAGNQTSVDWANVAEEIESLGASERRSLSSHIRTVIEHLMKLQASPAPEPRLGWREAILRARGEIEDVLEESPSLRREVAAIILRQTEKARRDVSVILKDHCEDASALVGLTYDGDRVLGPFLPD